MRRVSIVALVAVAAAVALVGPSAGAKPKPVKPGQFVTYTCASGETAGSGTVAWFDKDGKVISITQAKASGATLTAGPAPDRTKAYEWTSAICIPPTTWRFGMRPSALWPVRPRKAGKSWRRGGIQQACSTRQSDMTT